MNDLLIRAATASDAVSMIDIHARSIRALCRDDYQTEQIDAWIGKRTPEEYVARIGARPFFVAEIDSKLVGYAAYSPISNELLSVFVDPDFARQGVATALVDDLLASARSKGVTTLWLDSSLMAVLFYESVGFISTKEITHDFNGVAIEGVRMKIVLKD